MVTFHSLRLERIVEIYIDIRDTPCGCFEKEAALFGRKRPGAFKLKHSNTVDQLQQTLHMYRTLMSLRDGLSKS